MSAIQCIRCGGCVGWGWVGLCGVGWGGVGWGGVGMGCVARAKRIAHFFGEGWI